MSPLVQLLVFLLAALIVVPIAKRLRLASVLGYLGAGVAIGPHGLRLVGDAAGTLHFAELGVVLLLFIVGLELQPRRLWVMRRFVFGLGSAQVALVTAVLALCVHFVFALDMLPSLLLGFALSLSSTAFVLQLLGEQKQLNEAHGRAAFGVLLLQDLAVIPVIAAINLFAPTGVSADASAPAAQLHIGPLPLGPILFMLGLTLARLLLRPALRIIAATGIHELFTAAALAMVLGAAVATEAVGMSMGLGAFLAGMLVADSEFRHQLEADVTPFKGLLLGLFFMAVGMSVNLDLLLTQPFTMLGCALALMALKSLLLYPLARGLGLGRQPAARLAVTVSQGGEFAFVLLTAAVATGALQRASVEPWILIVTLSMALTPLAVALLERLLAGRTPAREFDTIDERAHPVVLLGFGRMAQIVGRVLTMRRIPFTALDANPAQIDFVRAFGNEVFYGDPTRLEVLRGGPLEKELQEARVAVIAVDDPEAAVRIGELLRAHFPHLLLFARARNRSIEIRLRQIGVQFVVRETLHSSLVLTEAVLEGLGVPADEAARSVSTFQQHDAQTLEKQMAVFQDETAYRQTAKDSALELRQLFEDDASAPASIRQSAAGGADGGGSGGDGAAA